MLERSITQHSATLNASADLSAANQPASTRSSQLHDKRELLARLQQEKALIESQMNDSQQQM